MKHRGEIIKKAVYQSGFPISKLAIRLGKSRRWIYLLFENNNVSLDIILHISEIIHHDFSDEIKELKPNTQEPLIYYGNDEKNPEYWKNKYLKLLEEYNELLKLTNGK
jgi:predicted transcriptional regulator